MKAFGVLLFIIGLVIRYLINRRRFNRRGVAGLQHFSTYESANLNQFIEGIGMIIALLFILGGVIIFIKNLA
jgi:hypothetical protein